MIDNGGSTPGKIACIFLILFIMAAILCGAAFEEYFKINNFSSAIVLWSVSFILFVASVIGLYKYVKIVCREEFYPDLEQSIISQETGNFVQEPISYPPPVYGQQVLAPSLDMSSTLHKIPNIPGNYIQLYQGVGIWK